MGHGLETGRSRSDTCCTESFQLSPVASAEARWDKEKAVGYQELNKDSSVACRGAKHCSLDGSSHLDTGSIPLCCEFGQCLLHCCCSGEDQFAFT